MAYTGDTIKLALIGAARYMFGELTHTKPKASILWNMPLSTQLLATANHDRIKPKRNTKDSPAPRHAYILQRLWANEWNEPWPVFGWTRFIDRRLNQKNRKRGKLTIQPPSNRGLFCAYSQVSPWARNRHSVGRWSGGLQWVENRCTTFREVFEFATRSSVLRHCQSQ